MNLNDFYVDFENSFRGEQASVRERLLQYEPLLVALKHQNEIVASVDLGCGRGEWLDILRQHEFDAIGVDVDQGMLQICRAKELNVEDSDAVSFLSSLGDSSINLVSGFHIAEHLQFKDLYQLVTEAFRVLKPGGVLLLETPNPENLIVASLTFHLDPTHQKPIPPQLLQFLVTHVGFMQTEILRLNQDEAALAVEVPSLTGLLFGSSPDYSVLAVKGDGERMTADIRASVKHLSGINTHNLATQYDHTRHAERAKLEAHLAEAGKSARYAVEAATLAKEEAIAAKEEAIAAKEEAIAAKERATAAQGEAIAAKEAAISSSEVASHMQQASSALERELNAMRDSWSWRITAPLRHIYGSMLDCVEGIKALGAFGLAQLKVPKRAESKAYPKLYVDVTLIAETDLRTGIQRAVRGILEGLFALASNTLEVTPVRLVRSHGEWQFEHADEFVRTHFPTKVITANMPAHPVRGDAVLLLDFSALAIVAAYKAGFLSNLKDNGVRLFPVIYDLLPISHPNLFPPHASPAHESWAALLPAISEKLLCISEATRGAYIEFSEERGLSGTEIEVFRLGSNIEGSLPSTTTEPKTIKIPGKNSLRFLMVGTIEPRKGHEVILKAFEALWERGCKYELLIVGKFGWQTDNLIEAMRTRTNGGRLRYLENVTDDELVECYLSADCLIAASIAEGYGLPLLEAAHYGIPIIARDIPSFREIAGQNACYFEDDRTAALVQTIESWASLYAEGAHPRSDNITIPTWLDAASDILALIKSDESVH